ncbi:MAG: hypothetical protein U0176_27105 [Bacteroidia bacterium]
MAFKVGPYTLEFFHFLAEVPNVVPYGRLLPEERKDWELLFLWDFAPFQFDVTRTPSWFLARVWKLTQGELLVGLNVDPETMSGSQDGAAFYAQCAVRDAGGNVIGIMEMGGDDTWYHITLQECSIAHDPNVLTETICRWFWDSPDDIAVCKITMYDFERQDMMFYFGWDGERFF